MLLHEVVQFAALGVPDELALVSDERTWTFGELWHDIVAMASRLAVLAAPGERVAVICDNRAEVLIIQYAAPLAGIVAMFANTRLIASEIAELIADVEPTALLGSGEQLDRLVDFAAAMPSVRDHIAFEESAFEDLTLAGVVVGEALPHRALEGDAAWIIHTSGTTGRAKGAVLTHRSILGAALNTAMCRPTAHDEVYLFPFPLFHIAAYNVVHLHLRRRPVVLVARFDPVEVMRGIERHRVTSVSLAPTMIAMLLNHPDRSCFDLSSLRHVFYGASAIPMDVLRRGIAELDCDFGQGYGMTELSGNAVFLDAAAHRRAVDDGPHLLRAAGRPGPMVAIRLVDDELRDVEVGAPGEIVVRGDQVIDRYWNRPDETAAARTPDGWFRTGDIGRVDDEGFLYLVDRRKDIIVTGGENVASREVEDVVAQHPHVAEVAVVAAPHDQWGEQVVAVVVAGDAAADADEIREWTRGRLAGFKRPRVVIIVESLPLNASGKVVKAELRALVAAMLA